jgi:hypothetical protein
LATGEACATSRTTEFDADDWSVVAIAIVRSESTQIVKALAREPAGAAGSRLLQQRNVIAVHGRFSGKAAVCGSAGSTAGCRPFRACRLGRVRRPRL